MTTDPVADVVVIGAGPAGSSTAIRLARHGHRVTLIDRATFPREKPCSEYMSPETVRQLDALGVLGTIDRAGGASIDGTAVSGPLGSRLVGRFTRAGGTPFRATGLGLARRILDATLVDAARDAGASVIEGMTTQDLMRDARGAVSGVYARDAAGAVRAFPARVVVGADGLGSVVARRAGLHAQGRVRRIAFVAHVAGVEGLSSTTELHVARDGYVGINAIGGGVANVAVVVPAHRAREVKGDATRFFHEQLQRYPAVRERVVLSAARDLLVLREARDLRESMRNDPLVLREARDLQELSRTDCLRSRACGAGRGIVRDVLVTGPFDATCRRSTIDGALLVGDAADFFDPFTGEGICSALRGGELAAQTLHGALQQRGAITARELRSYRSARRDAFLGKWIVERLVGYGMLAPALFDRAIARIERRGMADTLIGVTGQFVSPWRVVNPSYLLRMVL